MVTELRDIQLISTETVCDAVRDATKSGLRPTLLAEFVSSVDWGNADMAPLELRNLLGELEHWATEFEEGEITTEEYTARLRKLLERPQRNARVRPSR